MRKIKEEDKKYRKLKKITLKKGECLCIECLENVSFQNICPVCRGVKDVKLVNVLVGTKERPNNFKFRDKSAPEMKNYSDVRDEDRPAHYFYKKLGLHRSTFFSHKYKFKKTNLETYKFFLERDKKSLKDIKNGRY